MSEENDKKSKVKKLKKDVKDYLRGLDAIENDIYQFHDYTNYQRKLIYEDKTRSTRMVGILREFEKHNIYPDQIMNDLSSSVNRAISNISRVHSKWGDITQEMYGVTGVMSTSNLNMASGDEMLNLYMEEHKDQQPIFHIFNNYPVEKSRSEKIEELKRRLNAFPNLNKRLNEIPSHIIQQKSFSSLISIGNLIAGFMEEFLKTMAPDEKVYNFFHKKTSYFRCLFTMIGFDKNYDKGKKEYEPFKTISQHYAEIIQKSDILKHDKYTEDLSPLRYKVNKNIQEMIDYTNKILDLREIHYKGE